MSVIDEIATCDERAVKVEGPARSGKTEALVRRAVALLEQGIPAQQLCIVAVSGFAVQALKARLERSASPQVREQARQVRVQTVLEACVELLGEPGARAFTGREPRLLAKHEQSFMLEDLKTSGISNRRLKNMLGFIYRQWAYLKPPASWRTGEEAVICEQLEQSMVLMGGMLPQEAPTLACAYLKKVGHERPKRASYVLCDDFHCLSFAEQTAVCLMASTQLMVAGNPAQTVAQLSEYPNPEGFERFETLRRNVTVFTLERVHGNPQVARFAAALMGQQARPAQDPADAEGTLKLIKWNNPEDELNNLTKYLRLFVEGREHSPAGSELCVLVPNRLWARLVQRALEARGFKTCDCGVSTALGGDPRDLARARAQISYTRLNLLAMPDDMVAWRCWCGFGNYLTNSEAWMGLEAYAREQELTLAQALDKAAGQPREPFLRSNVLVERWRSGQEFIERNARRRGFALMHAIGAEELPEFKDLMGELAGDETPQEVFRLMRRHILDPFFPSDPELVHICTPQHLAGQSYHHIVVFGMVDGLYPKRAAFEVVSTDAERSRVMEEERRALYSAVAKADCTLTLSYFTKAPLELAEKSKMQVARITTEDGQRVALLRPSCFIQDAGASVPSTLGGQAFMAEQESKLTPISE
ncbi:MAG: UvrD-helicase domain-containing protein [Coriobacteriales bacterium]